jgi:hypothetical protein
MNTWGRGIKAEVYAGIIQGINKVLEHSLTAL